MNECKPLVLGTVILPWRLMNDASGYIFIWLIGYSALLAGTYTRPRFDST